MEPRRSVRGLQAEADEEALTAPLALLLQYPGMHEALVFAGIPGYTGFACGTISNGKIEVRDSELEGAGRGLFAGPASADFTGFRKGDVITLYGGKLLTEKPAKERAAEHTHMLRISTRGGSAEAWVDGRQFADGLSR